jgi:hypothetical protein
MPESKTTSPVQHSKEEKKKIDQELNEALEESFPGSDPISATQPAPSKPDGDSKRKA